MTKIEWTPPKRGPRRKVEGPIADVTFVNAEERCDTCLGTGVLYVHRYGQTQGDPAECDRCRGTGRKPPAQAVQPADQASPVCSNCDGAGTTPVNGNNLIHCWVCKGTGKPLPAPPAGDLHSLGDRPTWGENIDVSDLPHDD